MLSDIYIQIPFIVQQMFLQHYFLTQNLNKVNLLSWIVMSLWFLVFWDKAKCFIFHDVDFLKISGDVTFGYTKFGHLIQLVTARCLCHKGMYILVILSIFGVIFWDCVNIISPNIFWPRNLCRHWWTLAELLIQWRMRVVISYFYLHYLSGSRLKRIFSPSLFFENHRPNLFYLNPKWFTLLPSYSWC